jgi:hypothetical protein
MCVCTPRPKKSRASIQQFLCNKSEIWCSEHTFTFVNPVKPKRQREVSAGWLQLSVQLPWDINTGPNINNLVFFLPDRQCKQYILTYLLAKQKFELGSIWAELRGSSL